VFKRNRTPADPVAKTNAQLAILRSEHKQNEIDELGLMNRPKYLKAKSTLIALGTSAVPSLLLFIEGAPRSPEIGGGLDYWVANDAIDILGDIGDPESIPALRALMGVGFVSPPIALAVMSRGAGIPALVDALKDPDRMVRSSAAKGLGAARTGISGIVPSLSAALGDESPHVRHAAALALANLGSQASFALPALQKVASGDPEDWVRKMASRAIDMVNS
jgi:HEAT repeat protein